MDTTQRIVTPEDGHREGDEESRAHGLRRAAFLTAGVGIVHAVLFLLAYWLSFPFPAADTVGDAYMSGAARRLALVGLYVMPFAGIAFIWFIVALRMWTSGNIRRENVLLSNVQLVSGILYVAIFFAAAAAAAMGATAESDRVSIEPGYYRDFPRYGGTLLFVFGMRMAAMFVFTTTNIGRSAGILPRWFVVAGYAVGLFLLLSATFSRALVLVFPVWVLVLCLLLLDQARRIPASVPLPPVAGRAGTSPFDRRAG